MRGLSGKTAIITGAGSLRGIGRATAIRLAEEGANLVLNDIDSDGITAVVEEMKVLGTKAVGVVGDVSEGHVAQALVSEGLKSFGRCDILVNNAGITQSVSIMKLGEEDWDRMIKANLRSHFVCIKAAIPRMVEQKSGRIVCVSSISGRGGSSYGSAHYSASKAGIIGFARACAKELAGYGITVNIVAPASVDTDILKHKDSKEGLSYDDIQKWRISRTPLGRLASPDEVAAAIAFLASDEASFITGAVLDVNGGVFMGG